MDTLYSIGTDAEGLAASGRPYADEGQLLSASEALRSAHAVRRSVLTTVVEHVRSVAVWNGAPGPSWQLGDYAYYVVGFSPAPQVELYVQLWSEPEQPVLIELSSGYLNDAVRAWLTDDLRERICDRGFSIGGQARNYQKRVVLERPNDAEGLAREVIDLLVGVLGYDGRSPLRFQRCLETRGKSDRVYDSLNRPMLVTLMRQCGYVLEPEADVLAAAVPARTPPHLALMQLEHERAPRSGDYAVLTMRGFLPCEPGVAQHRVAQIHARYSFVTAQPAPEQELVLLSHSLLLDGGVTEEWLHAQLESWKALLAVIHGGRGAE